MPALRLAGCPVLLTASGGIPVGPRAEAPLSPTLGGSCPVLSFRAGSPYKPSSPRTTADCKGAKGKPRPWGDQNEQACLPDPLFRAEIRLISSDLP